jgi:hypothetical protein
MVNGRKGYSEAYICRISIIYILHVFLALLYEEDVHRCGMYKVRKIDN